MAGTRTRRAFLAGGASTAGAALAGCTGLLGRRGDGAVSLLAAGSLNDALENGLAPATGVPLRVEAHGSVAAARLVATGQRDPDILSLADVSLFGSPLDARWYAEFATNALVVAYDPDTPGGRRVADAGRDGWFRPVLAGDAVLGRTDPDLDPLGYRTLFALALAADYYDTDADLRAAVPSLAREYPETSLLSQFETGGIDAAVVYRSMAVARGYEFVDLPPAVDLSSPSHADRYRSVSYRLPNGRTVRGGVVSYGATLRDGHARDRTVRVFREHVTGDYLPAFGFDVPDDYPAYSGDAPRRLAG